MSHGQRSAINKAQLVVIFDKELKDFYSENTRCHDLLKRWNVFLEKANIKDLIENTDQGLFWNEPFFEHKIDGRVYPIDTRKEVLDLFRKQWDGQKMFSMKDAQTRQLRSRFRLFKKKLRDTNQITLKFYSNIRTWEHPLKKDNPHPGKRQVAIKLIAATGTRHKYNPRTITVEQMNYLRDDLGIARSLS